MDWLSRVFPNESAAVVKDAGKHSQQAGSHMPVQIDAHAHHGRKCKGLLHQHGALLEQSALQ